MELCILYTSVASLFSKRVKMDGFAEQTSVNLNSEVDENEKNKENEQQNENIGSIPACVPCPENVTTFEQPSSEYNYPFCATNLLTPLPFSYGQPIGLNDPRFGNLQSFYYCDGAAIQPSYVQPGYENDNSTDFVTSYDENVPM